MKTQNLKLKIQNYGINYSIIKYISFALCILSFAFFHCSSAFAVTSNELVENAHLYDGKKIEYRGEPVGDIMRRGEHAWINVNDGGRAIGVWARVDQVGIIKNLGNYNYIGDKIKVIGIFHRSCPEHGGDLDIHAQKISLMEEGYKLEHPLNPIKIVIAAVLFLAILALIILPIIFKPKP